MLCRNITHNWLLKIEMRRNFEEGVGEGGGGGGGGDPATAPL
jgi:hypothetical protein